MGSSPIGGYGMCDSSCCGLLLFFWPSPLGLNVLVVALRFHIAMFPAILASPLAMRFVDFVFLASFFFSFLFAAASQVALAECPPPPSPQKTLAGLEIRISVQFVCFEGRKPSQSVRGEVQVACSKKVRLAGAGDKPMAPVASATSHAVDKALWRLGRRPAGATGPRAPRIIKMAHVRNCPYRHASGMRSRFKDVARPP